MVRDRESRSVIRASAPHERCAYRHCKETFRPVRPHHRFCSQRCRDAYAYDLKRAEAGIKGPRKKRLQTHVTPSATAVAGSAENGPFNSSNSVSCKATKPHAFTVPRDVLGRGHLWPEKPSIDPQSPSRDTVARSVCAMTRADSKWERVRRLRCGHVIKLILARYGTAGVPDDDAGRPDLMELLYIASQAPSRAAIRMANLIELYAPWMQTEEAEALIQHIATTPDYQKARTSEDLGRALHLKHEERERLKLWSIRPCDVTEAEFVAQSKTRSEKRRAKRRRQNGVKPRAQYLAELRRKAKPWDGSGPSRWQWYRRNKAVSDSRRGVVETIVIEAEPRLSCSRAR